VVVNIKFYIIDWCLRIVSGRFSLGVPLGPVVMILLAVVVFTVVVVEPFVLVRYYTIMGPVLGSAVTLFAIGLSDLAQYYSSTTTLNHELDVECWSGDCRSGRISALVRNKGRVIVRDAKGVVSINGGQNLKGLLAHRGYCKFGVMYVNEHYPHVNGDALPWALPDKPTLRLLGSGTMRSGVVKAIGGNVEVALNIINNIINKMLVNERLNLEIDSKSVRRIVENEIKGNRSIIIPIVAPQEHLTSISPGQMNRLLIFNYDYNRREAGDEYVVRVLSENGDSRLSLDRICLRLNDEIKYIFEVTIHGEGLRKPYSFKMFIIKDKLNALVKSIEIAGLGSVDVTMDVLKEFKNDGNKSLIDRYWRIRTGILNAKNLDEYRSVAGELKSLWNDIRGGLKSRAPYLGIATGILNSYLVYLAAVNKQDKVAELLKEGSEALKLEIESNVLTRLMLRLLGIKEVNVDVGRVIELFERYEKLSIRVKHSYRYVPALRLLLGEYRSEAEALNACNDRKYGGGNQECVRAVKAINNPKALDELKNMNVFTALEVSGDSELRQYLSELDARSLILAYPPKTPQTRLTLILHELIEGRLKPVEALAFVGHRMVKKPEQVKDLFHEVYEACRSNCSINNEKLKLALLKLYHYYI